MKGKVNCTCGWSWNKSDSSKKDMYICHECGRDNSNNISKAQEGIETMSSRNKRGYELLIKDTENAKKDRQEFFTKGYIKNPRSVENKKARKELEKNQTSVTQDNRSDAVREIDDRKGRAKENKKQFKKNIIAPLDVATDIMQLGNFTPHPIGQTIGGIGNVLGAGIDAYQAIDDLSEGNYGSAAINASSVLLPMALDAQTFRRNSKYLQPGQPLYPLSPQANLPANATTSMRINIPNVKYIEPFTKVKGMTDTSLLANRALLGTLGAETLYDIPKEKNGGWLDNYNDSSVSLPEGYVGEGYNTKGRNYSPAWGGQFQMGGSLPGATGHMYARYEGGGEINYPRTKGIPSNGKYAKKTMASAQNGKEMKFYQEGLDWKPKSISRDGLVIKDNMGQLKYPGEITEINSPYITMQGVPYPVLGISDTGDTQMMYPEEEYEFDGERVTEYPMAKNGMRQEQKGLQNLEDLTNFTNYNKPSNWLNKYN